MKTTIELWAIVDSDGNYETGTTEADALERYRDNIQDPMPPGTRMVRLTLAVPLPTPIEVRADVGDDEDARLTAANV